MRTLYINHAPKEDEEYDVTFQCPVCLAIETLVIEKQSLMDSKHWRQQDTHVYHRDCGRPAAIISMSRRQIWLTSPTANFLTKILESDYVTISTIAAHIGVSRTTVKRWMLDKCRPNKTSRRKLAKYSKQFS